MKFWNTLMETTEIDPAIKDDVQKDYLHVKEKFKALNIPMEEDAELVFSNHIIALLKRIREEAHGYLHGHEVGGTNPSLLEALASTRVNLLLNVGFNREVGEDGALYWSKEPGSLAELLSVADGLTGEQIESLHREGRERILRYYNWKDICLRYEELFLDGQKQESGAVYENSYAN